MPFLYRVFGLNLHSELPLAGLAAASGPADVFVRIGTVPRHLPDPRGRGVLFEASPGSYLLRVDDVARFLAQDGRHITIDASASADPRRLQSLLLGAVFTALLHQRGSLVLHASGLAGPNGAVLIAGHSGAGKSTIASELAARGYAVIGDDAAVVVGGENGELIVQPGLPQLNLWKDAASHLGLDESTAQLAPPELDKYIVSQPFTFVSGPHPLAAICVLDLGVKDVVITEELADGERFAVLKEQTRQFRVMDALGANPDHFRLTTKVAAQVRMTRILRPLRQQARSQVADIVAALLG